MSRVYPLALVHFAYFLLSVVFFLFYLLKYLAELGADTIRLELVVTW